MPRVSVFLVVCYLQLQGKSMDYVDSLVIDGNPNNRFKTVFKDVQKKQSQLQWRSGRKVSDYTATRPEAAGVVKVFCNDVQE